jgi:hypothetical protein
MCNAFDAPTPEQGKAASEVIEELVALSTAAEDGGMAAPSARLAAWVIGRLRWRDRWVMRLSVISAPSAEADIDRSCEAISRGLAVSAPQQPHSRLPLNRGMMFPTSRSNA